MVERGCQSRSRGRGAWPRVRRGRGLALVLLLFLALAGTQGSAAEPRPDGDLIGELGVYRTVKGDTLVGIAEKFGFGYVELRAANPEVDPWLIEPGTEVLLPGAQVLPEAPRKGIVVNLPEQRLYYFPPDGGTARSFAIGIGRQAFETPTGETIIERKRDKPTWYPPPSILAAKPWLPGAVPPGPNNPLGEHALDLGWEAYVIHGTNRSDSIGRRVSYGCIRLYPWDIAWLFDAVSVGTKVRVVDQPAKVGWSDGALYLEVHPSQNQADAIERGEPFTAEPIAELPWRIRAAAGAELDRVAWDRVDAAVAERRGIPVRITR